MDLSNQSSSITTEITYLDFLESRYSDTYVVEEIESVQVEDIGFEEETYQIAKISIVDEDMIDIYIAFNADTEYIFYFSEINWETGIMLNVNFEYNETDSTYIDTGNNILYMLRESPLKDIIGDPVDNSDDDTSPSGRFWGWSCGPQWEANPGSGQTYRVCCYYIVWRENGCDVYSNSALPGANPRLSEK